jgi:hypothetical protein
MHMRKAIALGERVRGEECATKVLLGKKFYFNFLFNLTAKEILPGWGLAEGMGKYGLSF